MMGKMTGTQDGVGKIIELLLRLAAKSIAPRYTKMLHKERRYVGHVVSGEQSKLLHVVSPFPFLWTEHSTGYSIFHPGD
jgi:hypothetical protein